jgi:hypothetical protein
MMKNSRFRLFGKYEQTVETRSTNIKSGNAIGYTEVYPDVYVIDGFGKKKRLVDVLGLVPNNEGKYKLAIEGFIDSEGVQIWPGIEAVGRLNTRRGIENASNNILDYGLFSKAYNNMYHKIVSAKMGSNLVTSIREVEKILQASTKGKYKIQVAAGYVPNLTDPFAPLDQNLFDPDNFWNVSDTSKIKTYSSIESQSGRGQAYVGNTFLSYIKIQDVDGDMQQTLIMRVAEKATGKVLSDSIFAKKSPHTTHQVGDVQAKGQLDFEGQVFDPLKKYRRMSSTFTNKSAYGRAEFILEKMMDQSAKLAGLLGTDPARNPERIRQLHIENIREDLTGMFTSKQWQLQALSAEKIIKNAPDFIAEKFDIKPGTVQYQELLNWFSKPGNIALFKMQINSGLKGTLLTGMETILKMKNMEEASKSEIFEALSLDVAYDNSSKILSKGKIGELGPAEATVLSNELMGLSPEQKLKRIMGLSGYIFKRTKGRTKTKKSKKVSFIPNTELVLEKTGTPRQHLLDTLLHTKITDRVTGETDTLLRHQEVDVAKILGDEYLGQLSPGVRQQTSKVHLFTVNSLDADGRLVRRPIGGAYPGSPFDKETAWALFGSTIDSSTGEIIDPLELARNKLELAASEMLAPSSHIKLYGLAELEGSFSIEFMSRPEGIKSVRKLAEASKVPVSHVQKLVKIAKRTGGAKEVQQLKQYKYLYELFNVPGTLGTTNYMDMRRLLNKVFGQIGMDAPVYRDASGKMIFKNVNTIRHLSEIVAITTGHENLNPAEIADQFLKAYSVVPFVGTPKVSSSDETMFFGVKAKKYGEHITTVFGKKGDVFDPKRPNKIIKYSQHSVHVPDYNIAIFAHDIDQNALKNLGYTFDKDGRPVHHTYKDGKPVAAFSEEQTYIGQAKYFDEGQAFQTEAGDKKVKAFLDRNLDIDYSHKKGGEYVHPYSIYDRLAEKDITVFTKYPIATNRLIHNETGTIRGIPHTGGIKLAEMTVGQQKLPIHMFLSVGEALSKGAAPEILAQQYGRMSSDARKAYDLISSAQDKTKATREFIERFGAELGSTVKFTLSNGEEKTVEGMLLLQTRISARNLDADRQLKNFSPFGTWSKKAKEYIAKSKFSEPKAVEMLLTGQGQQDSYAEFSKFLYDSLNRDNLLPQGFDQNDMTQVVYSGFNSNERSMYALLESRLSFTDADALKNMDYNENFSREGQLRLSRDERNIEQVIKNIRTGMAAYQMENADVRYMESQAILQSSLDNSSQHRQSEQLFKLGVQAAVSEFGGASKKDIAVIMRGVMGAMTRIPL